MSFGLVFYALAREFVSSRSTAGEPVCVLFTLAFAFASAQMALLCSRGLALVGGTSALITLLYYYL